MKITDKHGAIWQLVPVKITEEMHIAAVREITKCSGKTVLRMTLKSMTKMEQGLSLT